MGKNKKKNKGKKAKATVETKSTDEAIVAALKKGKDKKEKKAKTPRVTMDSMTLELLRRPGGVTKAEIVAAVSKAFPAHTKTVKDQKNHRFDF